MFNDDITVQSPPSYFPYARMYQQYSDLTSSGLSPVICKGHLTKHFFKTLFILGDSQPEEAHRGPHVPAQDRQAQLRRDGGAASGAEPN